MAHPEHPRKHPIAVAGWERKIDRGEQRIIGAALRAIAAISEAVGQGPWPYLLDLAGWIDPHDPDKEYPMKAEGKRLNDLVRMLTILRAALDDRDKQLADLQKQTADQQARIDDLTPDADDVLAQQQADAWINANQPAAGPAPDAGGQPPQPAPQPAGQPTQPAPAAQPGVTNVTVQP